MKNSKLSVVMPVYNSEPFLKEAINSILVQTCTDFELIIVDDASTDRSVEIAASFEDRRIRILKNAQNLGIVYSRNKGLQAATGSFIAPFDSDDIAMPRKFEKQLNFLTTHPDYGLIGSWVKIIDSSGKLGKRSWKLSAPPEQIPSILLFRNYFTHSSVIIRREAMPDTGYSPGFDVVEDYLMWVETARKFKVWNYPEYLVKYRVHDQSAIVNISDRLPQFEHNVFRSIYSPLEIGIDNHLLSLLLILKSSQNIRNLQTLEDIEHFLLQILSNNVRLGIYNQKQLTRVVFNRWMKACYLSRFLHFQMATKCISSPLFNRHYLQNR